MASTHILSGRKSLAFPFEPVRSDRAALAPHEPTILERFEVARSCLLLAKRASNLEDPALMGREVARARREMKEAARRLHETAAAQERQSLPLGPGLVNALLLSIQLEDELRKLDCEVRSV